MTGITNYLWVEGVIKQRLEQVEGLNVKTTIDQMTTAKVNASGPTVVVIFKGDQVTDRANSRHSKYVVLNSMWAVSYLRKSAVKEYSEVDGQMILEVVKALEGFEHEELFEMKFTGTDPAWERVEGVNEVVLNFECSYKLNLK